MRDPHVTRVYFTVGSDEGISYKNPAPLSFSHHIGKFNLVNGRLKIEPSWHFANVEQARRIIEPFLWAWEIKTDLTGNWGEIRFKFDRLELVDRDPPPPGAGRILECEARSYAVATADLHSEIVRTKYPPPPVNFDWSEKLGHAYERWKNYLAGGESLQQTASFIFDYLKNIPGGEKAASEQYRISNNILKYIRKLSSYGGSPATSRKAPIDNNFVELGDDEKEWLEAAVRKIIHRIGEHASCADLKMLTLSGLPTLTRRRSRVVNQ